MELYLGTLGFFLEEFGRHFERLDEARSWKIARELADVSSEACIAIIAYSASLGPATYSCDGSDSFRHQAGQYHD